MLGSGQSLKCGLSRLAGAQLPAGRASGQRVAMLAGYRQPGLQSKIAIRENSSFLHFSRRHVRLWIIDNRFCLCCRYSVHLPANKTGYAAG